MIYRFTFLIVVLCLMAGGCKKKSNPTEEETPPPVLSTNQNVPPALVINVPADADGVFMASVIPHKYPFGNVGFLGNASAYLYTSPSNHTYVDGGTVKANDSIIPKLSGGSYYFFAKPISTQAVSGIHFDTSSVWDVTGNSVSGVPTFSFYFAGMPTVVTAGPDKASRTKPYEVFFSPSSGADSISVVLSADSFTVKKTVVAGAQSVMFTTSQVAGVRKLHSNVLANLNVTAYKITSQAVAGKKYYFINSITSSMIVYIGP